MEAKRANLQLNGTLAASSRRSGQGSNQQLHPQDLQNDQQSDQKSNEQPQFLPPAVNSTDPDDENLASEAEDERTIQITKAAKGKELGQGPSSEEFTDRK